MSSSALRENSRKLRYQNITKEKLKSRQRKKRINFQLNEKEKKSHIIKATKS